MTKKREMRRVQIRAADVGGKPGVTLKAITPGVVDDYGTVWMPDCFDEELAKRGPVLCWAHDWAEPLGPMAGYRTGPDGPDVDFQFSDFDAVPMARRAHAQVSDGTIGDCSVGFSVPKGGRRDPTDEELVRWPGVREIIEHAAMDELSLVLRGAVPGAKVLAVRAGKQVDVDAVIDIARRKVAGELTEEEARVAVELLGEAPDDDGELPPPPPAVVEADPELDAAVDAALALADRSAPRW